MCLRLNLAMTESSISVCVPTLSCGPLLKQCLQSLKDQTCSPDEVIVITNSRNRETILKLQDEFQFKIVYEDRLGLSHARNTGVESAEGEIVSFIDDDAIARNDWVGRIRERFLNDEKIGIVGGKIQPIWSERVSSIVKKSVLAREWLSLMDLGDHVMVTEKVIGCNFSLKKEVYDNIGKFDTNLGRIPGTLLGGEETDYCLRLRGFYKVIYDPKVVVSHIIPRERTKFKNLMTRAYDGGLSKSRQVAKPKLITKERRYNILDAFLSLSYLAGYMHGKIILGGVKH